nr:HNH endonuclease [Actinomycetota bacterium]
EVVFDEVDVRSIITHSRYIPARLRDALSARGLCCEVPGCGRTKGLERDHEEEFARGGPTSAFNVRWKCRYHHDLKTRGLYRLRRDENGEVHWEPTARGGNAANARAPAE